MHEAIHTCMPSTNTRPAQSTDLVNAPRPLSLKASGFLMFPFFWVHILDAAVTLIYGKVSAVGTARTIGTTGTEG